MKFDRASGSVNCYFCSFARSLGLCSLPIYKNCILTAKAAMNSHRSPNQKCYIKKKKGAEYQFLLFQLSQRQKLLRQDKITVLYCPSHPCLLHTTSASKLGKDIYLYYEDGSIVHTILCLTIIKQKARQFTSPVKLLKYVCKIQKNRTIPMLPLTKR